MEDEELESRIDNALRIIEAAFEDALYNEDCADLEGEIQRGHDELNALFCEVMEKHGTQRA